MSKSSKGGLISLLIDLFPYYKHYPVSIIMLLILLIADAIAIISLSIFYKFIINTPNNAEYIVLMIIALTVILLLTFGGYIAADLLVAHLSKNVLTELRVRMFNQIHRMAYPSFISCNTGDLLSLFTVNLAHVERALTDSIPTVFRKIYIFITSITFVLILAWQVAIILIIILPIMVFLGLYFGEKAKTSYENKQLVETELLEFTSENIELNSIVRVSNLVKLNQEKHSGLVEKIGEIQFKKDIYNAQVITSIKIFFYLLMLVTSAYSVYLIIHNQLTVGSYIAAISIFSALTGAIFDTLQNTSSIMAAAMSISKINDYLHQFPRIHYDQGISLDRKMMPTISMENVSFDYPNRKSILQSISFTLKPGDSLGIVGHSGSGKSTLLSLLLNLFQPIQGAIKINHHELSTIKLSSYYDLISVVTQEPPLFTGTILENITLGNKQFSEEEVIYYSRLVQLHPFISSLPDGYSTKIQRISNRLSGGQKQRIAIARALIRQTPILIMDEITSALDPVNEHEIIKIIDSLIGKKIIISISHRLATIQNMKEIIVLDKGKIVEQGTHTDLLSRNGYYAKLWRVENAFQISNDGSDVKVKLDYIQQIPLLSHLPLQKLKKIAKLLTIYRVEKNTTIITEGEIGDKFYIVVSGTLTVTQIRSGIVYEVGKVEDGGYFGEIALLHNVPRTATVIAKTPCLLMTLTQSQFQAIFLQDKYLIEKLRDFAQHYEHKEYHIFPESD